jgi:hypothetical protein
MLHATYPDAMMTRLVNKCFSGFYQMPLFAQWLIALMLVFVDIALLVFAFAGLIFPFNILLIPILKTLMHFMATPFLRLCGHLKYYSPMLLLVNNRSGMEIHNGAIFDYLSHMKWKQRGIIATKIIMIYYLKGLLSIIESIEKKEISDNMLVTGVSYFFSEKTAKRIGFTVKDPGLFKKFLFVLDYFNLFLMFSYSKGKPSFPNIRRLKKVEITASQLSGSKDRIIKALSLLECKNLAMGDL